MYVIPRDTSHLQRLSHNSSTREDHSRARHHLPLGQAQFPSDIIPCRFKLHSKTKTMQSNLHSKDTCKTNLLYIPIQKCSVQMHPCLGAYIGAPTAPGHEHPPQRVVNTTGHGGCTPTAAYEARTAISFLQSLWHLGHCKQAVIVAPRPLQTNWRR